MLSLWGNGHRTLWSIGPFSRTLAGKGRCVSFLYTTFNVSSKFQSNIPVGSTENRLQKECLPPPCFAYGQYGWAAPGVWKMLMYGDGLTTFEINGIPHSLSLAH